MKKKLSLIDLNNNEIKKNKMQRLVTEELERVKGGAKCMVPQCICFCPSFNTLTDGDDVAQEGYEWYRDNS